MNGFVFQSPAALYLLICIPLIYWLLLWARKRRATTLRKLNHSQITTGRTLQDLTRLLASVCMLIALARPGYDPKPLKSEQKARDVVFALDVSQSMLAQDVQPNRLKIAVQGVRDAIASFQTQRVGLIAYAGSASILCPLTQDYDFVRYMLQQVNTRTVDFGGTTLQSAVEKACDQVFVKGREGFQDLVILTDGGDLASNSQEIIDAIEQNSVQTWIIGIGDPKSASPIPLPKPDGTISNLQNQGTTVYTQLEEQALHELAQQSPNIHYLSVGTTPFNLGKLYTNFSAHSQAAEFEPATINTVYKEAAIFFMLAACLLLVFAESWPRLRFNWNKTALLAGLLFSLPTHNSDALDTQRITDAQSAFERGDYTAAEALFREIYTQAPSQSLENRAALQFNIGLCAVSSCIQSSKTNARLALDQGLFAQQAFLKAKRYQTDFKRATIRLEQVDHIITELQQIIDAAEVENQQQQDKIEQLTHQLKTLLKNQKSLRQKFKQAPEKEAQAAAKKQQDYRVLTHEILDFMQNLENDLNPTVPESPPTESLLTEPLRLMPPLLETQQKAINTLPLAELQKAATQQLRQIELQIRTILEQLSDSAAPEYDEDDDYDEMEDYEDYMQAPEGDSNQSDQIQGDYAASSEMQPLPTPNYSIDDILLEEKGSQQFREQKRAASNAQKVKQDF